MRRDATHERRLAALVLAALALGGTRAWAEAVAPGERVGLFVGSNGAPPGRAPLVHAEADARNLRRVFVELGAIAPGDAQLVEAPTADALLRAIEAVPRGARVLVFFYSGHADARGLLLEGSTLDYAALDRALAARGAALRLELVDACRSGAMTRRKGATLGKRLQLDDTPAEGRVIVSSAAEWEDAHESDALGASFFTLHLATGLRGAADADRDGQVSLSEAYAYVYARTVESTLGAGTQHPTYAYDARGRGDVVLSWPERASGRLSFGDGEHLVVDVGTGRVVAEVRPPTRALALPPGVYRVHKRTAREVLSGRVTLAHGQSVAVEPWLVEREAHARLVRKGRDADPTWSLAVRAELGLRGRVDAALDTAPHARVGVEASLAELSLMLYGAGTLSTRLEAGRLGWDAQELGLGVRATRALDLPWLTLRAGVAAEALRLTQTEAEGREPARVGGAAALAALLGVDSAPLVGDVSVGASVEAALYVYRATSAVLAPTDAGELATRPTVRAHLVIGWEP
jgi:hypothetical protein